MKGNGSQSVARISELSSWAASTVSLPLERARLLSRQDNKCPSQSSQCLTCHALEKSRNLHLETALLPGVKPGVILHTFTPLAPHLCNSRPTVKCFSPPSAASPLHFYLPPSILTATDVLRLLLDLILCGSLQLVILQPHSILLSLPDSHFVCLFW